MARTKTDAAAVSTAAETPVEIPISQVSFRPLDELVGYARNARTHSAQQVDQIAASIVEFGFTNPVLADAQGIVAGHGRVLGARKVYASGATIKLPNGVEIPAGTVPVLDCTGWSETKRRAYILADNQIALNAGWDFDLLKVEFDEFAGEGFNFDLLGFSDAELQKIRAPAANEGLTDPDEESAIPAEPVTRLGDVWVLGNHRIICGDSTSAEVVAKLLAGAKPHLMVTDPPYGVEYDAGWRNDAVRANGAAIGGRAVGKVENDDRADWREAWALSPADVAYVWHAGLFAGVVAESLQACDFQLRSQIIWSKSNFAIGRGDYHWHHEPCWYAVKKGATGHWVGDRKQTTVWSIAKPQKSDTGHSTQKPVDCMRIPIENNSIPGDAIYEPFSGSGTTIIACEMTGRLCYAIELNPAYVDVAVTRWERFTGQAAVLEGDGRRFAEVAAERCPAGQVVARVRGPKPGGKRKAAAQDATATEGAA